jgi:predicted acyltransferase
MSGVAIGALLHAFGLCPLVKRIWTPSWAIYSAGWVTLMLAGLYYVVDLKGYRRWTFPFLVVGMNSIAMYVLVHVAVGYISRALRIHLGRRAFEFPTPTFAPINVGAATLVILWLMLFWMYRRKIFLRI